MILRVFVLGAFLASAASLFATIAGGPVRLNSLGFPPDVPKRATVVIPDGGGAAEFTLRRAGTDEVVWRGQLGPALRTAATDTDETVHIADFGAFREAGRYQMEVLGAGRSTEFTIARDAWNEAYSLVTRGLTLWRCGSPAGVRGEWRGQVFAHGPCHLDDGWMDHAGGGHVRRPATGGWHDAGDYNKYIVNAGYSLGLLFKAWEHFRPRIERIALDVPASERANATPDLLDEMRWEIEWFFTMQAEDGRVHHKLSQLDFRYWGAPDKDVTPRYFTTWSTNATAHFVAVMTLAARHYAEFDATFARRCLAAARLSWACLERHPENVKPEQQAFSTGGYDVPDPAARLWAAAELWATTRETKFLVECERRAAKEEFTLKGPTWGDVRDLGLATYLETDSPERDAQLVARLRGQLLARADGIVAAAEAHPYGRPLGGERGSWYWGANGDVASQTFLLHVADRVQPSPQRRGAATHAVAFLLGRNFHGRSYVTGLGHLPPAHPHDRRGEPAWPGYLVGGGHPTGRSWVDEMADYRQNEIALNWNAALIYALAAFVEPPSSP
jgi:endoglucanase